MPAPLVSALGYLLAPRAINAAADYATKARVGSLVPEMQASGMSSEAIEQALGADPYLRALQLVSKDPHNPQRPLKSGLEESFDSLMNLFRARNTPSEPVEASPDARTIADIEAGRGFNAPDVQPVAYIPSPGGQFLTPMDHFLRYGGRDDDDLMRYLTTNEGRTGQSYGQTSEPAPEIRFDAPLINQETGEQYTLAANGGLMALMRGMYAQR